MAKPNYAFEKRQKELAKKQKAQQKLQQKMAQQGDRNSNSESVPAADTDSHNPNVSPQTVHEGESNE